MKKYIYIFIFCIISLGLSADFIIEQDLLDTLNVRAIDNLETLPKDLRDIYDSYLENYPDGLMAYLISTENSGSLWDTDPQNILDNYLYLKKLFQLEDFEKYPDEFVLSYIAKTTVSHEQITNYRKVFAEAGLLDYVRQFPDLTERIRQVTLWTRARMTFVSTSGRTQDPLSVMQKSNIGRCGEMQVFYIAALRTAGIPARPAWTPWWAHTDNNHAWTEIFLDGNWHYAESTSPAYFLDSTWFSASSQKTLFILARSSFPDSTDDVVSKGKNNNYVNSTRFYQDTRQITINVVDDENKPIEKALVNICAFNYAMYRPLLTLEADSTGVCTFTVGKGGFMAIAFKDSLYDHVLVPYDAKGLAASYELVLKKRKWEDFDFTLQYPKGSFEHPKQPEEFIAVKKQAEQKYDELIMSFDAKEIPVYLPQDSVFAEIYKKCRNNKQPLLNFVKNTESIPTDFWIELDKIDEKFLWQADQQQFQNIYYVYLNLKKNQIHGEDFTNLLSPSVFYEILPQASIPEEYLVSGIEDSKAKIKNIIAILHSKHVIDKDKAVSGLLSLDKLIQAEFLQDSHFKTLSCYALKSNLIPAQYTRIPSVIMVKLEGVWQNYDVVKNEFVKPQDESKNSLVPLEFTLVDEKAAPVTINPDNISVTIFREGRFYYNDRQLEYDKEFSKLKGELNKGDYQLQFCIRESGEITKTKLIALEIENQKKIEQTLVFKDFKRNWKDIDKKYLDFLSKLTDKETDWVLLLGNYDHEPPQRLAAKVRENLAGQQFLWVGEKEPFSAVANYIHSPEYSQFIDDNSELKNRLITFYYDKEKDKWKIFEGNWDVLFK